MMDNIIAPFLKGIDNIIFDMDGVITSEQNYWNTASLTVYELLNSDKYFGTKQLDICELEKNVESVRKEIFYDDKLIELLKAKGVNSNWDLAYIVLCFFLFEKDISRCNDDKENILEFLFHNFKTFFNKNSTKKIYTKLRSIDAEGFQIYELISEKFHQMTGMDKSLFTRDGVLWQTCQDVFQQWYLGEEMYIEEYNKKPSVSSKNGLMKNEKPIIPVKDLEKILKTLHDNNIKLGIGTGRVYTEIHIPLSSWGLEKYFDRNMYITYTDIIEGEKKNSHLLKGKHLTKPHPFMFLKGIYGRDYSEEKLLKEEYDKSVIGKTLIVGDAGSDIMAAQAIDCKFAAVLTGVAGEKARRYFEEMNSDYILDSIREFMSI